MRMKPMDIKSLEIYLSLCRNLHFGRTSEAAHLSPSALSRLIQRLEDEAGSQLLERDNRRVSLTPAGEIFMHFAEDVLHRHAQLRAELDDAPKGLRGRLSLFASVTASQSILPDVLSRFRAAHADVHIELETGYAVNAAKRLAEGIDVVVAALSDMDSRDYLSKPVRSIPMLTVAPPESMLAIGEQPDWRSVPVILPSAGFVRDSIENWYSKQRITPNRYSEVAGNEAILSLVALGCGIGFVPELVLENSPLREKVRILRSGPELPAINVGFCTRARTFERSPLVQAFWGMIDQNTMRDRLSATQAGFS
ncbi:MAG: HTH-type transcriptional activator IlvY [Pseudomonadales bacterium]|nr:HTH-type transcriptional activator IlvY [Pseudomonadales bacterium]